MATSIGQYAPVFLPREPSLTEKPGSPQSTGPQRVGHDQSDPEHTCPSTPLDSETCRVQFVLAHHGFPEPRMVCDCKKKFLKLNYSVTFLACVCLVTQSCPTLCDPMDCSPPGSSVYVILQARIFEWVAIPFSRVSSRPRN